MISYLNEEYKMTGASGREYTFTMYGFGTFDELQEKFKDYPHAGLYVFTIRDYSHSIGKYTHEPVYLGQTGNFQTRDFANYHKREEIETTGSRSIGICLTDQMCDEHRKDMEKDLLEAYDMPCNEVNN
jgi:hypothetical protein